VVDRACERRGSKWLSQHGHDELDINLDEYDIDPKRSRELRDWIDGSIVDDLDHNGRQQPIRGDNGLNRLEPAVIGLDSHSKRGRFFVFLRAFFIDREFVEHRYVEHTILGL